MDLGTIFTAAAIGIPAFILIARSLVMTEPAHETLVTSFGKFKGIREPGLSYKHFWQKGTEIGIFTRTESDDLNVATTDTNDTKLPVRISWSVSDSNRFAFENNNPREEMISIIYAAVREQAHSMSVEDLFGEKDSIKKSILEDQDMLSSMEKRLGIKIENIIIDEPKPPQEIINAKKRIETANLELQAAEKEAKTLKIKIVAKAEADMERRDLEGQGAAKFKANIVQGIASEAKSIVDGSGGNITAKQAMDIVLRMLELEVQEKAAGSNNKVFFMGTGGSSSGGVSLTKEDLIAGLESVKEQNNPHPGSGGKGTARKLER